MINLLTAVCHPTYTYLFSIMGPTAAAAPSLASSGTQVTLFERMTEDSVCSMQLEYHIS